MPDNISDATIISETNPSTEDLLQKLSAKTQTKEPKAPGASDFWKSEQNDSDFEPKEKNSSNENSESPAGEKNEGSAKNKLTQKEKEDSAKVAVGMLAMLNDLITKPVLNHKLKSKFNEDEFEALEQVIDKSISDLVGPELELRNKWDRLIKKHDAKRAKVDIGADEKKRLIEAFETYFDVKQTPLPPEWFLAFAAITFVGQRVIDISFD